MVNRQLSLMDEFGSEEEFTRCAPGAAAIGPAVVLVVAEVYKAWSVSVLPDKAESARPAGCAGGRPTCSVSSARATASSR